MTNKTKTAIEEATKEASWNIHFTSTVFRRKFEYGFKKGVQEVIDHPERYELTDRKPLGIQDTRELVNQMLDEEISFSRFVELINEGGNK